MGTKKISNIDNGALRGYPRDTALTSGQKADALEISGIGQPRPLAAEIMAVKAENHLPSTEHHDEGVRLAEPDAIEEAETFASDWSSGTGDIYGNSLLYAQSGGGQISDAIGSGASSMGVTPIGGVLAAGLTLATIAIVSQDDSKPNNPPAVTAGPQSQDLMEVGIERISGRVAGNASATIQLTKEDPDAGDVVSYDDAALKTGGWMTNDDGVTYTKTGTYGLATLTTATGVVSYQLDNANNQTNALATGDSVTDDFTVYVKDGSTGTASTTVSFLIKGTDDSPPGGEVWLLNASGGFVNTYSIIQDAVTAASDGYFVYVGAGTFKEDVTIAKDINIKGAGATTDVVGSIFIEHSGVSIESLEVNATGKNSGIELRSGSFITYSDVALTDVTVSGATQYGIELRNNVSVIDMTLTDVTLTGNKVGLRSASGVGIDGLTITGGTFADNTEFGILTNGGQPLVSGTLIEDIWITETTFANNGTARTTTDPTNKGANTVDLALYGYTGNTLTLSDLDFISANRGPIIVVGVGQDVDRFNFDGIEVTAINTFRAVKLEGLIADEKSFEQLLEWVTVMGTSVYFSELEKNTSESSTTIEGTAFNDLIIGSVNAETIVGGAGADRLTGGAGADVLIGGAGSDRFVYATDDSKVGTIGDSNKSMTVANSDVIYAAAGDIIDLTSAIGTDDDYDGLVQVAAGGDISFVITAKTVVEFVGVYDSATGKFVSSATNAAGTASATDADAVMYAWAPTDGGTTATQAIVVVGVGTQLDGAMVNGVLTLA